MHDLENGSPSSGAHHAGHRSTALRGTVLRGIIYMCIGVSIFPLMNATVKYYSLEASMVFIIWIRYLSHLAAMAAVFVPRHGLQAFRSSRPWTQAFRSVLLLASTGFYFVALSQVSLVTAAAVGFTAPLIVAALALPLLGEAVGARRWGAVVLGFLGVLVVVRPGGDITQWEALLALGTAACYALYQVLTRKLASHDPPETTILYTALVAVAIMSVIVPFAWSPPDATGWLLLVGAGVIGGFGHLFVVKSYQYGPAAVIAPFGYAQLFCETIVGYLVFSDFPDAWTWVGAAIIIASGGYITLHEAGRARRPAGLKASTAASAPPAPRDR
ncbi:MAG: DMT family transporter [Alphaproteobacteria bacterium]|nr:DMT family transporter [Alphaproteobacteria bacterium]